MIRFEHVCRTFEGRKVLDNINLQLREGKIYVLKGVSGSGKTTLLNILGGLDSGYTGCVETGGIQTDSIAYMLQKSVLISGLSVYENLKLIKDDDELIKEYSRLFDVDKLLERKPEKLSGGERQRISLIRCLLRNPKLIIADEPTASLDLENACIIAKALKSVSNSGNIIVIATHEDCFDDVADEILYLKDGRISEKKVSNSPKVVVSFEAEGKCLYHESDRQEENLVYRVKTYMKKYGYATFLKKGIAYSLFLGILFLAIIIQANVNNIMVNSILKDCPITTFSISNNDYNWIGDQYPFTVYENYQIKNGDATAYILLDSEHSGLAAPGIIQYGSFPVQNTEVIVNREYLAKVYYLTETEMDSFNADDYLGREIILAHESFTISGILGKISELTESKINKQVYSNVYYKSGPSIYVPYDKMKEIGSLTESNSIMVSLDGLYRTKAATEIREYMGVPFSVWDEDIMSYKTITDSICYVLYGVIMIVCFVMCLFIHNEIMLEFYYRQREIGYLQIIGIKKKEVHIILVLEKSMQYLLGSVLGLLSCLLISLLCSLALKQMLFIPVFQLTMAIIVAAIYIAFTIEIPCRKIMKKDLLSLLHSV